MISSSLKKRGGKSDFRDGFESPLRAAVLVISDSAHAGVRSDKSGQIVREFLEKEPVTVEHYGILPDEQDQIAARLIQLADKENIDLIITSGGTGFGPRDVTPEAVKEVIERQAPGIAEAIRSHGRERLPYAMLSRQVCGTRGKTMIVTLPGSANGARESMQSLFPGLLHVFPMMDGGGH